MISLSIQTVIPKLFAAAVMQFQYANYCYVYIVKFYGTESYGISITEECVIPHSDFDIRVTIEKNRYGICILLCVIKLLWYLTRKPLLLQLTVSITN